MHFCACQAKVHLGHLLKAPQPCCRKSWWQVAPERSCLPSSGVSLVWGIPQKDLGIQELGWARLQSLFVWRWAYWGWNDSCVHPLMKSQGSNDLQQVEPSLVGGDLWALQLRLGQLKLVKYFQPYWFKWHLLVMAKWSFSTSTHEIVRCFSIPKLMSLLEIGISFLLTPIIMFQIWHSRIWIVGH